MHLQMWPTGVQADMASHTRTCLANSNPLWVELKLDSTLNNSGLPDADGPVTKLVRTVTGNAVLDAVWSPTAWLIAVRFTCSHTHRPCDQFVQSTCVNRWS